jgi:hypothetical protein
MVKTYTLLLNGGVQRLSQVYASGANNAQPSATDDLPFRQLRLQQVPANAAVIYVGADATVSATNHGASLDPTQASAVDSLDLGPFDAGPLKLSDLYVIGSNNERLAILGVPF